MPRHLSERSLTRIDQRWSPSLETMRRRSLAFGNCLYTYFSLLDYYLDYNCATPLAFVPMNSSHCLILQCKLKFIILNTLYVGIRFNNLVNSPKFNNKLSKHNNLPEIPFHFMTSLFYPCLSSKSILLIP